MVSREEARTLYMRLPGSVSAQKLAIELAEAWAGKRRLPAASALNYWMTSEGWRDEKRRTEQRIAEDIEQRLIVERVDVVVEMETTMAEALRAGRQGLKAYARLTENETLVDDAGVQIELAKLAPKLLASAVELSKHVAVQRGGVSDRVASEATVSQTDQEFEAMRDFFSGLKRAIHHKAGQSVLPPALGAGDEGVLAPVVGGGEMTSFKNGNGLS